MTPTKPLSLAGLYLVEDIVLQRCREVTNESAQEAFEFAVELARRIDQLADQREKDWGEWYKEQYRLTERNRAIVKAAQTNCAYCDGPLDQTSHTDHIRPVKDGGTGELTNLVEACSPCNLQKNGTEFWKFSRIQDEKGAGGYYSPPGEAGEIDPVNA
jgi:hypothetical protein